jgi:hypothetical protein
MTVTYPVVTSIKKPGFFGFLTTTRLTLLGIRFAEPTDDNPYLGIDFRNPVFTIDLDNKGLDQLLIVLWVQKNRIKPFEEMVDVRLDAIPVWSISSSSEEPLPSYFVGFRLTGQVHSDIPVVYIPKRVCLEILKEYPARFKKVSRRFSKIIRDRHRKD